MLRVMEHFKSYDFPGKLSKNNTFENYSKPHLASNHIDSMRNVE